MTLTEIDNLIAEISLFVGSSFGFFFFGLFLLEDSSWLSGSLAGSEGKVDMRLRSSSDHEGWDIDQLFTNGKVSLSDQRSGFVDGVGESSLEDDGLESSVHELWDGKSENVIELVLGVFEESESDHSFQECITFENSSGISDVEGKKLSGGLSDLSEEVLNSENLSL